MTSVMVWMGRGRRGLSRVSVGLPGDGWIGVRDGKGEIYLRLLRYHIWARIIWNIGSDMILL